MAFDRSEEGHLSPGSVLTSRLMSRASEAIECKRSITLPGGYRDRDIDRVGRSFAGPFETAVRAEPRRGPLDRVYGVLTL